jgi:hypothetical protein
MTPPRVVLSALEDDGD